MRSQRVPCDVSLHVSALNPDPINPTVAGLQARNLAKHTDNVVLGAPPRVIRPIRRVLIPECRPMDDPDGSLVAEQS